MVRVVEVREEAQYQLEKYDRVGVPGYSTPVHFQLLICQQFVIVIVNCQINYCGFIFLCFTSKRTANSFQCFKP